MKTKNTTILILTVALLELSAAPGFSSTIYSGNGNTGFGGPVGNGSLELSQVGTTGTINGTITNPGGFNDTLTLYVDSIAGGFNSTSTQNDTADTLRRATSWLNGAPTRATIQFDTGFNADFSMALSPDQADFGGVFDMSTGTAGDGSLSFVTSTSLSPTNDANAATYTFSFDLSDIGLSPGASFAFVSVYGNANDIFLSDEGYGNYPAISGNPGNDSVAGPPTLDFTGVPANVFSTVPEPAGALLLICGVLMTVRDEVNCRGTPTPIPAKAARVVG